MTLHQKIKSKAWCAQTCLGCGIEKQIRTYKVKLFSERGRGYRCFTCAQRGDGVGSETPRARDLVEVKCLECHSTRKIIKSGLNAYKSSGRTPLCHSCRSRKSKGVIDLTEPLSGDLVEYTCEKCGGLKSVRYRYVKRRKKLNRHLICHGCSANGKSRGETDLYDFLKKILNGNILKNERRVLGQLFELDIFIPHLRLGVEYNGNHWHSERSRYDISDKTFTYKHFKKRELSNSKGIRLIQIRSDEWANKRPIVESMLKAILGKTEHRHFARKLTVKEVPGRGAVPFLNENHLMGGFRSARHIGLYTPEGLLVQLFSYKLLKEQTEMDCSRICSLRNHSIVGGVSRLLKHALRKHPSVGKVISFVDLRYADGHSLKKIGFVLEKITLGWGWTDGRKWFNRLQCKAIPEKGLTEREHAALKGWFRIYDAGQAKYEWEVLK